MQQSPIKKLLKKRDIISNNKSSKISKLLVHQSEHQEWQLRNREKFNPIKRSGMLTAYITDEANQSQSLMQNCRKVARKVGRREASFAKKINLG